MKSKGNVTKLPKSAWGSRGGFTERIAFRLRYLSQWNAVQTGKGNR